MTREEFKRGCAEKLQCRTWGEVGAEEGERGRDGNSDGRVYRVSANTNSLHYWTWLTLARSMVPLRTSVNHCLSLVVWFCFDELPVVNCYAYLVQLCYVIKLCVSFSSKTKWIKRLKFKTFSSWYFKFKQFFKGL